MELNQRSNPRKKTLTVFQANTTRYTYDYVFITSCIIGHESLGHEGFQYILKTYNTETFSFIKVFLPWCGGKANRCVLS